MELIIEQSCPSCGAAIVVNEDDKLIQCEFCDVSNFRIEASAARYVLPYTLPEDILENDVIFIPYLRFKGCVYFVENEQVRYKIVDTTRIAVDITSMQPSLGLRPQVMKVRPVTVATGGQFVLQTVPVKAAFLQAAKLAELFSKNTDKTVLHRAFIGETISVIYQPCFVKNDMIVDAVDGRNLGNADVLTLSGKKICTSKQSWEPRFIGTLCPDCGSLLRGESDSRVLGCTNCSTHWEEDKGKLVKIDWSVVDKKDNSAFYFPFWKLYFTTSGYSITDFGDFIDFTNQPIFISEEKKQERLSFILPAFKINPKKYLQIASQLTISQGKMPQGTKCGLVYDYPVTLNRSEAVQSVKSVLAHLTVGKKKKLYHLPQLTIKVEHSELLFLPFSKNVHDYIQNHTSTSIQVAAVRYGRSL